MLGSGPINFALVVIQRLGWEALRDEPVPAERAPDGADCAPLPAGPRRAAGGRPAGGERHRLRDPPRPAVEGRAPGVRPAQDASHNRFIRWSRLGVVDRIFAALSGEGPKPERIMIDSPHLKAHRTAASLLKKGLFPAVSGASA